MSVIFWKTKLLHSEKWEYIRVCGDLMLWKTEMEEADEKEEACKLTGGCLTKVHSARDQKQQHKAWERHASTIPSSTGISRRLNIYSSFHHSNTQMWAATETIMSRFGKKKKKKK